MLKVRYLGHSCILLSNENYTVLIDPFLKGNPNAAAEPGELNPQFIILTHAHGDHLGDAIEIAKRTGATIIAVNELAKYCASIGLNAHAMHVGGSHAFPFGRVKFTIAHHSSALVDGRYMGPAAGVIVKFEDKIIYHCGDTGLFYDMKLIGDINAVDLMFAPIGDNYTMGIDDAVKAVELVQPKLAVPIHYNTFPVIQANPDEFVEKVAFLGKQAQVMNYGEEISI